MVRGMNTRIFYLVLYIILALAVGFCAFSSRRSKKGIGKAVSLLELAFLPPIIGHIIIIFSEYEEVSFVGYYFYFIGMNCVMAALIKFTDAYCKGPARGRSLRSSCSVCWQPIRCSCL